RATCAPGPRPSPAALPLRWSGPSWLPSGHKVPAVGRGRHEGCPSFGREAIESRDMDHATRRQFLQTTAASVAALGLPRMVLAAADRATVRAEIARRHDEGVARLQDWI